MITLPASAVIKIVVSVAEELEKLPIESEERRQVVVDASVVAAAASAAAGACFPFPDDPLRGDAASSGKQWYGLLRAAEGGGLVGGGGGAAGSASAVEDDDDDDDDDDDERPSVGCAEGLTVRMATFRSQSMMNPRGSESDSLRK